MDQEKTIADNVASYFVSNGQMGPVVERKRKFSALLITPPSSRSSSSVSATFADSESFQATHRSTNVPFIEIPDTLFSVESYVYMGFTEMTARQIWNRYITRPHDMPDTFLDFASAHVNLSSEPDVYCADEDWDGCLRSCGINQKMRNAILMAEFEDIRYSQSAKYWATEAIGMNYEALETINERLKEKMHAQDAINQRRRPEYTIQVDDLSRLSSSNRAKEKGKMKDSAPPPSSTATAVLLAPICPQGYTTLWKGLSKKHCEGFINPVTQELEVKALASSAPSDFSSSHNLIYFTPQKALADRYASWAKHKAPHAETAIVQVNVPVFFSEQKIGDKAFSYMLLNTTNPDNEWKQIVWHAKGNVREPRHLRDIRRCGLLIGHCPTGLKLERLASHRLVGDQHVLKFDDSGTMVKAIQWVLQGDDAEEDFNERCKGNAWVWDVGQLAKEE
jgi:hypothetical protein